MPIILLVLGFAAACGSAQSSGSHNPGTELTTSGVQATVGDLAISGAYIPEPASLTLAGAVFVVTNTGARADKLLSVSSPDFTSAMLHATHTAKNGSETMTAIHHPLVIPAHGRLVLQPAGDHVMLMHPHKRLHKGEAVPLTLHFAHAGEVTVEVPVVSMTGPQSAQSGSPMTGMAGM